MARWGLTGGIASGKSSVAARLWAQKIPVIDADQVYHGLLVPTSQGPSPLVHALLQRFPFAKGPGHTLDRRALGAHVFADPEARRVLEHIAHPAVQAAVQQQFAAFEAQGHTLIFYDVPLLFERALSAQFAGVVLVWVPQDVQLQRLMARDKLDEAAARLRLKSQWPLDAKRALSTHVIDNSKDAAHTDAQVERIVSRLRNEQAPRRAVDTI
jgi:dephospho-CoA kinase